MEYSQTIEHVGEAVEAAGVAVIVVGIAIVLVRYVVDVRRDGAYHHARRRIGRSILLGLEILVAGDIIRTVAVDPDLTSVAVLAGIVLIRTFLSFTLEVEISGRLPWQHRSEASS